MSKKIQQELSPYNTNYQNTNNNNYSGTEELWAAEKYLQKYNFDTVKKLSGNREFSRDVLEFGAGIGTLANIWHSTNNEKPECLEIDDNLRNILFNRGFHTHKDIDFVHKKFDIIYTSNVLEHIEDDVATLKKLKSKIKIGGTLAVYVPAFPCLYSELDSSIGHYRRYQKRELIKKLKSVGFDIHKIHYADSLGFFAWLYSKAKGYKEENKLGNNNLLFIYDRYIYPLSKLLDSIGFKHLFGKNLLIIAKNNL